jgi:hypothetical protein
MSKYPKDPRPANATCPEGLEDIVEWEQSRADYHEEWREKLEARNKTLKARVKELEVELGKLKKAYDVVSAYATHFTPDHKLEDKLKEENEAYE